MGSSITKAFGLQGQRDGDLELTALAVAEIRRCGGAISARPTRSSAAIGPVAQVACRQLHARQSARAARAAPSAPSRRFAAPCPPSRAPRSGRCAPARARAPVRSSARSRPRPSGARVPASGASAPEICAIRVDFPAPFGPITAWISPGRRSIETSSVALSAPKLSEVARGEDRLRHAPLPPGEEADHAAAANSTMKSRISAETRCASSR
jgi:hypothetical protein